MIRNALKGGFTLIELLVTLILLGLLTAVVFPVVVQQIDDAEPTKAANDLANIKTGIEVFHLNVRPTWPGDLEDLVHEIDGSDVDVEKATYNNTNKWNGPYIDAAVGSGAAETGDAVTSGFGMSIQNQIVCYNESANTFQPVSGTVDCVPGTDFVALLLDGETTFEADQVGYPSEFTTLNELVDNEETGGWDTGKIRLVQTDGSVLPAGPDAEVAAYIVYLVAPFTN